MIIGSKNGVSFQAQAFSKMMIYRSQNNLAKQLLLVNKNDFILFIISDNNLSRSQIFHLENL